MSGDAGRLLGQTRHEFVSLVRTPITLVLSILFPLVFFILLAALVGNEVIEELGGIRFVQYLAPGLASFGVVMATFSFLAIGLADARAKGVVKRQLGTPAPRWVLLGGRIGAATVLGLVAVGLVLGVGVAFYDLQLFARSAATLVLTLLVSSMAFCALGLALALLLPSVQATLAVTNGIVIPLAFVSDMFTFSTDMPEWLETVAWIFPLKHMVALFGDALDPTETGSSLSLLHLGVIVAWGVLGVVASLLLLRQGRDTSTGGAATSRVRAAEADLRPRRASRPSVATLFAAQTRHTNASLWRDASGVFFAVVFPVALVAIIPTVNGGGDQEMAPGLQLGTFFAATMAVYGAAVTAYVNMPQGLAEERELGILKRTRAAPVPAGVVVGGRIVAAVAVALLTLVAIAALAAVMYGSALPPAWPAAVLTFLVASTCFAVLGLAVASLARTAQAQTGIALGTLLPLSFISDVFVFGVEFPPVLDTISLFFPLRHAANAMTTAVSSDVTGTGLSWDHLAVMLVWTLVGAAVLALRFRWTSEPRTRAVRAQPAASSSR